MEQTSQSYLLLNPALNCTGLFLICTQYRVKKITPNHNLIKLVLWSTNVTDLDIQLSDKLNKVIGIMISRELGRSCNHQPILPK